MAVELKTYGDLKKAIKAISLKQKGEEIGGVVLDTLLGAIPGFGAAKTTFDIIKAAISKPDNKKTNTWLDKLDIDDNMSKIVDDTVENGFMQLMSKTIEGESDNKPLEQDFNMNQKLVDFLKNNYKGRTVTGIKENKMKKSQLKQIIKEEVKNVFKEVEMPKSTSTQTQPKQAVKQTSDSKLYSQTASKATSLTTKAKQIDRIDEFPGAFQSWFDSLGLVGKPNVTQQKIVQQVRDTLIKMGIK